MGKKGKKGNRNPDDPKPDNTQTQDNQSSPTGSGGNPPSPQQQQQREKGSKTSNSDKEHTKPDQSRKQEGGQQQQQGQKKGGGGDRSRGGDQQGGGGQQKKPFQAEGGDGSRDGQKQDQTGQQQNRPRGQQQQVGDSNPSKSQQPQQGGKKKAQSQNPQLGGAGDQKSGDQQPQGAWGGKQQGHQRSPQQQGQNQPPKGPRDEGKPQQSSPQEPQGAWGGKQQGHQRSPQQQGQNQPPKGPRDEGKPQQSSPQEPQSAWAGKQKGHQRSQQQEGKHQTPRGPRDEGKPQQSGAQEPQGAWGNKQQGHQRPQQQEGKHQTPRGPRDEGKPQQSGAQEPQGAWGNKQQGHQRPQQQEGKHQTPRGPRDEGKPQQSGAQEPQGAWGGKQQGHQRPQQQEGQNQTPRGPRDEGRPQQSGAQQPQGAWGNKQQGQNQPPKGPRDEGKPQQSGAQEPQGAWGGKQQGFQRPQQQEGQTSRSPRDDGRSQGTPRRGPYQQRQQGDQQQRSPQYDQGTPESDPGFKEMSCAGIKRGTMGIRGVVETNYFTMDLKNMPDIAYHYDVAIEPDRPKKFMRIVFNQCQREHFPTYAMAYDGSKSCYTVKRLPNSPYKFKIEVADGASRTKEFTIKIKETDVVEVELKSLKTYHHERVFDKPMRALQTLEVVLASSYHDSGLRVGRSFFRKPSHNMYNLEDGYEMYTGIYQAAILGEEPLLNIDISHKSFPKAQCILNYLNEIGVRDLSRSLEVRTIRQASHYLKGLNILYKPPECFGANQRSYKVVGVGEPANKIFFSNDEGKKMSVTEYFQSRGYKLKYPNLNCVQVGSSARSISLPMELCAIIEYQSLMRKDNAKQVSKMITHSATSTTDRKQKIMDLLRVFQGQESLIIRDFGVRLGQNFIKVQMRVLQPPQLQYFNNILAMPSRGSWQIGNGWKYLETSKPKTPQGHKWAIIYDKSNNHVHINAIYDFKNCIYKTAQDMSMNLAPECLIDTYHNIDMTLKDLANQKYALVIVILPLYGTSYASVKQTAELKWGVLTQCIKERTVQRSPGDKSVCTNLLLKLNAKLNGTNHKIGDDREAEMRQLLKPIKNVMFLGADVTHPSPDQRQIPSVVGVAASHDAYGACYNMQYRLQRPTLEDIDDMEGITEHHLKVYKKYQNRYPDYIIYYRDGVSDGQFPIIKRKELRGIRAACKKSNCNAKLTCLIVVKRHHTRFFPLTKPTPQNKYNNVEPGTVVDQRIVHPNEVQFFLVSHQAVQGTAKPTRYNVIEDDSNFNIDLLQKLSFNLCHMFPRCNRSVSYPAPAYLAHLVAFRGRVYLEGANRFGRLEDEYKKRIVNYNIMENNPMYFV